jgi:predicted porin
MGRHDTPLKLSTGKLDLFADTMADYNGTIGFQDLRADNAVAYISPSFSGFTLAAAIVPGGMSTGGAGQNIDSDSIAAGYSIAGIYSNGPFYGSVAYESLGTEQLMSTNTALLPCAANPILLGTAQVGTQTLCNKSDDDLTKWRVGLGLLDWNGFSLTGIYEQQDGLLAGQRYQSVGFSDPRWGGLSYMLPLGADERELWQIQAGYRFGNFQFKAMYGETSSDANYNNPNFSILGQAGANAGAYLDAASNIYENTTTSWALGVDYNFSKRTQVYVLYTANTSDAGDAPRFTNGLPGAPGAGTATPLPPTALANSAGALQMGAPAREWDGFSIGVSHRF